MDVTVAICTRDRPDHLHRALDALDAQSCRDFVVLVVDQSRQPDPELARRAADDPRLTYVRDPARGLSRSRNIASRAASSEWVTFVDDDCVLEPDWMEHLQHVLNDHPQVAFVTGHVEASGTPSRGDHVAAAARPVLEERVVSGRWVGPEQLGFGVCMVLRRSTVEALGGWDERFGAGVDDFPASEDVDFNYRFLRSGAVALATPRLRAKHEQWRSRDEVVRLYRGYAVAGAAFPVKHLLTGDIVGGLWLWSRHTLEVVRLLVSGIRHRSPLRVRIAAAQLTGVFEGTARALVRHW